MAYGYDGLNRLTSGVASSSGGPYAGQSACWIYDDFGNRLSQSVSSVPCANTDNPPPATFAATDTAGNQIATVSAPANVIVQYDGAGNVTNDGFNSYVYDAEGRICAVNGPQGMTGYQYDAEGRRIGKGTISSMSCDLTSNGYTPTTDYVLDQGGGQMTEVAVGGGTQTWVHTNVTAGGMLIATYDRLGLHFYLNDALGSRRVQTDAAGFPEQTCQSLPFGDQLFCTGSLDSPTEHHFTGKERDAESGLDYFGARYYASSMGRWMSPDKPFADQHAQNPQSWNLYAYARNNPLTAFDPNGEAAVVLVNGNNVTIFFPVSFSGNANTPANQAAYTAAITSAWTGQFGNYNTTMHVVSGDPGGPLTNDVHINAPTAADGAFPRPTTDVGGPNMNFFGLGDNAAQNNYEKWASGHETGHGMGEQDQYHDATGPNPGYEHNIMGAVNGTPDARDINNVLAFHGNTVINITPSTPLSTETTTVNQTIPLIQLPQLQLQPRNIQQ